MNPFSVLKLVILEIEVVAPQAVCKDAGRIRLPKPEVAIAIRKGHGNDRRIRCGADRLEPDDRLRREGFLADTPGEDGYGREYQPRICDRLHRFKTMDFLCVHVGDLSPGVYPGFVFTG